MPFKSARPSSRWQVWPLTVIMGVSRVRQTSTPKFIRGGRSTSDARTVSAVSKSPVGTVTTVQLASLGVNPRHRFGRGIPPPPTKKTYNSPTQAAAKLCAVNRFVVRDDKLQIFQGNVSMNNKDRKSFVIKQSKGCKFVPKLHQNTCGGPTGVAYTLQKTA